MGKNRNLRNLDGNDEWRSGGCATSVCDTLGQLFRVERNKHSEEENKNDVEQQDAVEGELDGTRDDLSWVGSLSDSNSDQFGAKICKYSCGHS